MLEILYFHVQWRSRRRGVRHTVDVSIFGQQQPHQLHVSAERRHQQRHFVRFAPGIDLGRCEWTRRWQRAKKRQRGGVWEVGWDQGKHDIVLEWQ